ncbi:MAG: zinc-ribbon domain-containing protein [Clostridia bacterium]|nr:zinc-ribbon domain-containing protein [Clostridia bacterium]
MAILDNVSETISKVARNIAKGTNKVVESSKVSIDLLEKKDDLKDKYAEIGKLLADCDDKEIIEKLDVADKINEIRALSNEIVELKIKLSELKNTKKCPDCGANISKNSAYCNVCGSKII